MCNLKYHRLTAGLAVFASFLLSYAISNATEGKNSLEQKIEAEWNCMWNKFYYPKTSLFYDYIDLRSEEDKQREKAVPNRPQFLDLQPSVAEINAVYPNWCGWGTGMEDCTMSNGVMLSLLCDIFDVTKDARLKEKFDAAYRGLVACAEVDGDSGFVARGLSIDDGKSYYPNSSRDQYTHCVHGLWYYYHSPICPETHKEKISKILRNIADRMQRNVVPENNYDFLRSDGKRSYGGLCKMLEVDAHEAARLPMFYIAAYDVSKEKKYLDLYEKYIDKAIEDSEKIDDSIGSVYPYLQMQYSLELLRNCDSKRTERINSIMLRVSDIVQKKAKKLSKKLDSVDVSVPMQNWRFLEIKKRDKGFVQILWPKDFFESSQITRQIGELPLVVLMANGSRLNEETVGVFSKCIEKMEPEKHAMYGMLYHCATYWKSVKLGKNILLKNIQ